MDNVIIFRVLYKLNICSLFAQYYLHEKVFVPGVVVFRHFDSCCILEIPAPFFPVGILTADSINKTCSKITALFKGCS